jgi:carboxyl-terminal processing protease
LSVVSDSPAQRAGLAKGDVVVELEGFPAKRFSIAEAQQRMHGPVGEKLMLAYMRPGFRQPQRVALSREIVHRPSIASRLFGATPSIAISAFFEWTDSDLAAELDRLATAAGSRRFAGLVLDLRGNPGGLVDQAVAVADRFLPAGRLIVRTRGRAGQPPVDQTSKDPGTEPAYPMVILVDAGTASAAEILAGALQDNGRAVVLGEPTYGKGSVQTVIELANGSALKLTVGRYETPGGRSIQERGVIPDYDVPTSHREPVERERDLPRHLAGPTGGPKRSRALPALPAWPEVDSLGDPALIAALKLLHFGKIASASCLTAPCEREGRAQQGNGRASTRALSALGSPRFHRSF